MDKLTIIIILVVIAGVGLYIGITNLSQQYGIEPGGSNAGQYACAPDRPGAGVGQTVTFTASVPEGQAYYWSAPDGTSVFVISGPLSVRYGQPGTKTASLFYLSSNVWRRTVCTVVIR